MKTKVKAIAMNIDMRIVFVVALIATITTLAAIYGIK